MIKAWKGLTFFLLLVVIGFQYKTFNLWLVRNYKSFFSEGDIFNSFSKRLFSNKIKEDIGSNSLNPSDILGGGDSIIFLETTDRMHPPPLVLCAMESAARVYSERPVIYFMKGLNNTNSEDTAKKYFPILSNFKNVYYFPLRYEEVFRDTPLLAWYEKVNLKEEIHWVHVASNGCRLALIWKFGGLYMDTDIISVRTIPHQIFLAAEHSGSSSNAAFGFSSHHYFPRKCLEDFVRYYKSKVYGQQGPILFTRAVNQLCNTTKFMDNSDRICGNITYFHPQRLYPISYPAWGKYYQVWKTLPTFNNSYGLHLWNYMNSNHKKTMVPGSNTLVEHLYLQYCPSTYAAVLRNETNPLQRDHV